MTKLLICAALAASVVGCKAKDEGLRTDSSGRIDSSQTYQRKHEQVAIPPELHTGQIVRVHFRRDALGLAAPAPLAPTSDGVGGKPIYLNGEIREITGDWLVIADAGRQYWIPREMILLVEATQQSR
ncbi:MAG TPA: hypothetical protein VIL86_06185 [Tepidisphaeraceae bacterium]|jgi:hypothetical protein